MLTPLDIQKKEFRRAFRGYSEDEVDSFLDQITQDYEQLYRENRLLKEKLAQAEAGIARYREIEEVLKSTMILAQKNAEELRQNAEKEASLIIEEAKSAAAQITAAAEQNAAAVLNEAEKSAKEILGAAEEKKRKVLEEFSRLKSQAQAFVLRFSSMLEAQLKMVRESFDEELEECSEIEGEFLWVDSRESEEERETSD